MKIVNNGNELIIHLYYEEDGKIKSTQLLQLYSILNRNVYEKCIIDFNNIYSIDSDCIGVFLLWNKLLHTRRKYFSVRNIHKDSIIGTLIMSLQLDTILTMEWK